MLYFCELLILLFPLPEPQCTGNATKQTHKNWDAVGILEEDWEEGEVEIVSESKNMDNATKPTHRH